MEGSSRNPVHEKNKYAIPQYLSSGLHASSHTFSALQLYTALKLQMSNSRGLKLGGERRSRRTFALK